MLQLLIHVCLLSCIPFFNAKQTQELPTTYMYLARVADVVKNLIHGSGGKSTFHHFITAWSWLSAAQLHSDKGCQFESLLLAEVCRSTDAYTENEDHSIPSAVGWVGRTLEPELLHNLSTCERPSKELGRQCETNVYDLTSYHRTHSFYLMFGRQAKLPVELMYGTPQRSMLPNYSHLWLRHVRRWS